SEQSLKGDHQTGRLFDRDLLSPKWSRTMAIDPTVFVVDDDHALLKSLMQLVRSVRLPVETFHTGEELLAALPADCFGCIVIDVRMPAMTGLELQRKLT